jgi:hypothetical protein
MTEARPLFLGPGQLCHGHCKCKLQGLLSDKCGLAQSGGKPWQHYWQGLIVAVPIP